MRCRLLLPMFVVSVCQSVTRLNCVWCIRAAFAKLLWSLVPTSTYTSCISSCWFRIEISAQTVLHRYSTKNAGVDLGWKKRTRTGPSHSGPEPDLEPYHSLYLMLQPKPGLVAFYDVRPANRVDLFYSKPSHWVTRWPSKTSDLQLVGHRSKSRLGTAVSWASYLHLCASVTKQYNMVGSNGEEVNRHTVRCTSPISLDFTVNRFFMKLFRTSDILIVHICQSLFGIEQPSVTLSKRFDKFVQKYATNI